MEKRYIKISSLYFLLCLLFGALNAFTSKYHNYVELTDLLRSYSTSFPEKTYLYSIGKSIQNRELWVLAIADSKPSEHVELRPEVKYIGNMHGNEVPSKEILLRFIDNLLLNQSQDASIDYLMKNMRIHILASMNPDGFEVSTVGDCYSINGRANNAGYDLNRNFPDLFETNTSPIQPETKAVMDWLEKNNFILSANFHGGSVVVNYPYDNYANANYQPKENPTYDDDVFKYISKNYSYNHPTMRNSQCSDGFQDGITNGAEWYPVTGGMQDFNYWKYGCMEVTIEISCCKYPPASNLETIWQENKKSLVEYLKQANTGVKGVVRYANGIRAQNLTVKIDNRQPYFKTNINGEFFRILLPGIYKLSLMYGCNAVYETSVEITSNINLVILNITLSDDLYDKYKTLNSLDKYGLFCTKEYTVGTTTLKNSFFNAASHNHELNLIFIQFLLFILEKVFCFSN